MKRITTDELSAAAEQTGLTLTQKEWVGRVPCESTTACPFTVLYVSAGGKLNQRSAWHTQIAVCSWISTLGYDDRYLSGYLAGFDCLTADTVQGHEYMEGHRDGFEAQQELLAEKETCPQCN